MTATLKDVSGVAGVAPSTVSYVLSGKAAQMKISKETEQKVISAAKKLNYRANMVAKNLRRQSTRTVGIVFNDLFSSWANEVMAGVTDILLQADYQPLLGITFFDSARERKIINAFLDNQVEALIVQPHHASADFYRVLMESINIPMAFVGDSIRQVPAKVFMIDGYAAGRDQIDHLYSRGHRKIALVASDYNNMQTEQRTEGALARILEYGLHFPPEYRRTTRNMSPEQDILETMYLLEMPDPPTAIAVINDAIAYRVLSAVQRLKRNVAVIGIGNLPESSYEMISLSSIEECRQEMGLKASEYILKVISGQQEKDNVPVLLRGKVLPRNSTLQP